MLPVAVQQANKKVIQHTSFGSVCLIWSLSKDYPRIINILLSRPGLPSEKRASIIYPDTRKSSCAAIDAVASSIRAYLEGENITFSLNSVDLSLCSKFQQSVLRAQYEIPRGSVSTYGLIAARVGAPGGARAIGNALAGNPFPLIIPCHRTIRSDLRLGGFQSGTEMKRALLEMEGIVFDKVGKVICGQLYYEEK